MSIFIAYLISGICLAGFVNIWFWSAYKELSAKRSILTDIEEQLRLHEGLYTQARNGPDEKSAAIMLETSRILCCEAAKGYNRILNKPINRIPALLMGFRAAEEHIKGWL